MRVNADSEWERQCGRERGRESLAWWEEGRGKLLSSRVHDAWAFWWWWGGPEKVKTNTNGGAQRYTSNQRQTLMKVSGNVSDIPAPQANK